MSDQPSETLIALLEHLRLATTGQMQSVAAHVRRLAGELPSLDSVWVDALVQARLLSPYQAGEINAGRGDQLQFGPYVVLTPWCDSGFASCFRAIHRDTRQLVQLAVIERLHLGAIEYEKPLARLVADSAKIRHPALHPVVAAGIAGRKVWAACEPADGQPATKWMVERGRFTPQAAEQIAREIAEAMCELERADMWHTDLNCASVMISAAGKVQLVMPGLRGCLRPYEGYAMADLPPEAFDTLSPQRITDAAPISVSTELYAWGCVAWNLLTGRPPFSGGSSLTKLQAVHAARLADIWRLAPECSESLRRAIHECLELDPSKRPKSFAALAELLGPATRQGANSVVSCLSGASVWRGGLGRHKRSQRRSRSLSTAALVLIVASLVGTWPMWRHKFGGGAVRAEAKIAIQNPSGAKREITNAAANEGRKTKHQPQRDDQIRLAGNVETAGGKTAIASAAEPVKHTTAVRKHTTSTRRRLELPTDRLLKIERLKVEAGQVVTGRDGQRAHVQTPPGGLIVKSDDVVFENIDFVGAPPAGATANPILALQAATCTFVGCTFQSSAKAAGAAIDWSESAAHTAAGGELRFVDCTLYRVASGVELHAFGNVVMEFTNTLFADAGPMVRLDHVPQRHESVKMALDRVTLRSCKAALECRYENAPAQPGRIEIIADNSVLDPRVGLLTLIGDTIREAVLGCIVWSGQGSLLAPSGAVAVWGPPGKRLEPLEDDLIEVAGLVRSEVVFAGPLSADPAQSRATDWQVPLRSDEAPGIGPSAAGRGALATPR